MTDIYTQVANNAAKLAWQATSAILPQVGIWGAAILTGNVLNWAFGGKNPVKAAAVAVAAAANPAAGAAQDPAPAAQNPAPSRTKSFLSKLNPVSALKSLNPASLASFAVNPFTSVKKALSWAIFEEVAYKMNDTVKKPFQAVAPIAEKFMTPIAKKFTTPVVNYLQNNGLMQLPKPDIICPEAVCPEVVCETIAAPTLQAIKGASEANLPGMQTSVAQVWDYLTKPIVDLTGYAAKAATQNPTPIQEVFAAEPVKQAVKVVFENTQTPIKETAKQAAARLPQGYLELTEHYAEPAGRYVANTMSSAYHTVENVAHKVGNVHNAVDQSIDLLSNALGIHRGWLIAAGVTGSALVLGSTYMLWNRYCAMAQAQADAQAQAEAKAQADADAKANASAQAQGGNANGNNVSFLVQFPQVVASPQGGAPSPANDAGQLAPQISEVTPAKKIEAAKK